jgi:hypothetical protein
MDDDKLQQFGWIFYGAMHYDTVCRSLDGYFSGWWMTIPFRSKFGWILFMVADE